MGRPICRRSATISAKVRAAKLSKGRIRPANRISASVTVVVKRKSASSRAIHAATAGDGEGFIASDKTLVSRTIIAVLLQLRWLAKRLPGRYYKLEPAQRLQRPCGSPHTGSCASVRARLRLVRRVECLAPQPPRSCHAWRPAPEGDASTCHRRCVS
jgi:hypothetical protein